MSIPLSLPLAATFFYREHLNCPEHTGSAVDTPPHAFLIVFEYPS